MVLEWPGVRPPAITESRLAKTFRILQRRARRFLPRRIRSKCRQVRRGRLPCAQDWRLRREGGGLDAKLSRLRLCTCRRRRSVGTGRKPKRLEGVRPKWAPGTGALARWDRDPQVLAHGVEARSSPIRICTTKRGSNFATVPCRGCYQKPTPVVGGLSIRIVQRRRRPARRRRHRRPIVCPPRIASATCLVVHSLFQSVGLTVLLRFVRHNAARCYS